MSFTRTLLLSGTAFNRTMGARARMRPSEEEFEVGLPSEAEAEAFLFISKKANKNYLELVCE